jgi:hypothetical protein
LLTATYHRLAGGSEASHDATSSDLARPSAWEEDFLAKAADRYAAEMSAIKAYAVEHDKRVVFVILPTREAAAEYFANPGRHAEGNEDAEDASRPMLPVERAQAIFEGIGARVLDLTPIVGAGSPEEMYFAFDGHLTPRANERVAEAFVREVEFECRESTTAH